MKIRIDGGTVVGWSGAHHELIPGGTVMIEGGRSTRIDETDLLARAEAAATRAWDNWEKRDWAGRKTEEILPPAFPTRRAD